MDFLYELYYDARIHEHQVFNSQPEDVGTKGTPTSRWWESVWSDMKKGRITNWRQTYRNKNERKKAFEQVKDHLGLQTNYEEKILGG